MPGQETSQLTAQERRREQNRRAQRRFRERHCLGKSSGTATSRQRTPDKSSDGRQQTTVSPEALMTEPSLTTASAIDVNIGDNVMRQSDMFQLDDDVTFQNIGDLSAIGLPSATVSGVPRSGCQVPEWNDEMLPQIEFEDSGIMLKAGAAGTYTNTRVTPLHMAVQNGSGNIVRLLLKHGADCNARDSQDMTPLIYTIIKNQESIAGILLLYGAQIAALDRQSRSALHWAVIQGQDAILKLLVKHCKDDSGVLDSFDAEGKSPLHTAISLGLDSAVEILCDAGANVQLQTQSSDLCAD